jgi:hypothetical protein
LWQLKKPWIETPSIEKFLLSMIDCMAAKYRSLVEWSLKGVALPINSNWDTRAFKCKRIIECGKVSSDVDTLGGQIKSR